jgi:hypothetical protein
METLCANFFKLFRFLCLISVCVNLISYLYGMTRFEVANGGGGLQKWKAECNILNKQF